MIEGLQWDLVEEDKSLWLERPFEEGEIRLTVFGREVDKALCPDGFSVAFL